MGWGAFTFLSLTSGALPGSPCEDQRKIFNCLHSEGGFQGVGNLQVGPRREEEKSNHFEIQPELSVLFNKACFKEKYFTRVVSGKYLTSMGSANAYLTWGKGNTQHRLSKGLRLTIRQYNASLQLYHRVSRASKTTVSLTPYLKSLGILKENIGNKNRGH